MSPSWLKPLLVLAAVVRTTIAASYLVTTGQPCANPGNVAPNVCDPNNNGYIVEGVYYAAYCNQSPSTQPYNTFETDSAQNCLSSCSESAPCAIAVYDTSSSINVCSLYVSVSTSVDKPGAAFFFQNGACTEVTVATTTSSSTTTSSTTTTSSSTTSSSTTSSSTTSSSTATTTSALPACSSYPSSIPLFVCVNDPYYAKNGHVYQLLCTETISGTSVAGIASSFTSCINSCTPDAGCTGVVYDSGTCTLYSGDVQRSAQAYSSAAIYVGECSNPAATTTTSSSTTTSSTTSSTTTTTTASTTSSTSSSTTSSTTTTTTASTTSGITTTTSSSSSTDPITTSTSSTTTGLPTCTASVPVPSSCDYGSTTDFYDRNEYVVDGRVFQLNCGYVISGVPLGPDQAASTLTQCVQLCADEDDCYGASYTTDDSNCQLLPADGVVVGFPGSGSAVAAIVVSSCQPASVATTTSSTSSTTSETSTTTTSTDSTTTTTSTESTTTTSTDSTTTTTSTESTTTTSTDSTTTTSTDSTTTTSTDSTTTTSTDSTTTTTSTESATTTSADFTTTTTATDTSSMTTTSTTSSTSTTTTSSSGIVDPAIFTTSSYSTTTTSTSTTESTLTTTSSGTSTTTATSFLTSNLGGSTTTSTGSSVTTFTSSLTTSAQSSSTTSTLTTTTSVTSIVIGPGGSATLSTSLTKSTSSGLLSSSTSTTLVATTSGFTTTTTKTVQTTISNAAVSPILGPTSAGAPFHDTVIGSSNGSIVSSSTIAAQWGVWEKWTSTASSITYGSLTTNPASQKGSSWDNWKSSDPSMFVTITLTTTFIVPCSTGWETSTVIMTTTHCGCTETPVPTVVPMKTYNTICPSDWGFGTSAIVLTVPAPTASSTPIFSKGNGKTGKTATAGSSLDTDSSAYTTDGAGQTAKTISSTSSASWPSVGVEAASTGAPSSLSWDTWKNSTDSSATLVSSTKVAAATNSNGTFTGSASAAIKTWTGAASSSGAVCKIAFVMVGGLMVLFL